MLLKENFDWDRGAEELLGDPLLLDSVYISCPPILLDERLACRVLEAEAQRRAPDRDPMLKHEAYERPPHFSRYRVVLLPLLRLPYILHLRPSLINIYKR